MEKKHELVFEHPSGMVLSIATDDILELSQAPWFQAFFEDARSVQSSPAQAAAKPQEYRQQQTDPYMTNPFEQQAQQQQRQVQRPAVRQQSFLDVSPDAMTTEYWGRLTNEQREAWQRKWVQRQ
jgi:hypothetical protein